MGFPPNRFFVSIDDEQVIFLVVTRSLGSQSFALNYTSLEYLTSKPTLKGFVVLAEPDLTPVATFAASTMKRRLADVPTKAGDLGPYWWLDEAGEPTGSFGNYASPF